MQARFLTVLVISWLAELSPGQRLRGRIRSSTFRRNMDEVEPGAATLAFVFDVTGSMWDDLQQVIAGAKKILDTTLNRQEKPLHDYVLVPFHDPIVGPITVTSDGILFQRKLRELFVQGGGDCPEMSLTAIKESLEISLPNSFIYVFTDASAKDYDRLHDILKIIQRKQSQVIFVLTGDCNNRDSPGYKAYEKIAATSSGQVFFITKSDVSEVVKFIEVSVQAHKVVLLATDHTEGADRDWVIPFDPELKEVTISLSGPDRRLKIFDPYGRQFTERDGLDTLLELESVLIVNIKNATKGRWKVSAFSSGEHSLRVTGLSTLDFQARFSRKPTVIWEDAGYQPVEGAETYMLVNATGLTPPGYIHSFRLKTISGDRIQGAGGPADSPPDPSQPHLYVPAPYLTPEVDFYVYVYGVTHDGSPFQRATKNAILNIEPVAPSVYMNPTHPGYFDYPAEIPCRVNSLIPFHVSWSRRKSGRWIPAGHRSLHEESTTVYLRITDITEEAEGLYRCVANNSKGIDYGETYLDVEERPPLVTVKENVTAEPLSNVILTCYVSSSTNYSVTWSRQSLRTFDQVRVTILPNNSLSITRVLPKDEGFYQCSVRNAGGTAQGRVYLTIQAAPFVSVRPRRPIKYVTGNTVSLRCIVTGYPRPSIQWLNSSQSITPSKSIRIRRKGTELRFVKAGREHEGVYTCKATNVAGTAVDNGKIVYTELPTAVISERKVLIQQGDTFHVICVTTGVPTPQINWYFGDVKLRNGARHNITADGSLTVSSLLLRDAGQYHCVAINEVGRANDSILLNIGIPPIVTVYPQDPEINIGARYEVQCEATGHPQPDITWSKLIDSVVDGEDGGTYPGGFEILIEQQEDVVYHDRISNRLIIQSMRLEDVGAYFCSATNIFGSDAKAVQISITGLLKPAIESANMTMHVVLGQDIDLPCKMAGTPTPSREWYRHQTNFIESDRVSINSVGSISISSAQISDKGEYICVATNEVGFFEATRQLDVWVPPTISTTRKRYETDKGVSIIMDCVAHGNPRPTIDWFKKSTRRIPVGFPDYEIMDNGSLIIRNPMRSHSGTYACRARNDVATTSINAVLEVYYKPEAVDGYQNIYTTIVGNAVTLKCPVTDSKPAASFAWSFGNTQIDEYSGKYQILQDGSLKILSSEVSDNGSYSCIASNRAGSVSLAMLLFVYVPPKLFGPLSVKVLSGEDVALSCEARGIPTPFVEWSRNDVEITGNGRFTVSSVIDDGYASSTLLIQPARLLDDGDYICSATNIAGNARHTIALDVQERPYILNPPTGPVTPSRGTKQIIPCTARGDPAPTIKWYFQNEEIFDGEGEFTVARNGSLIIQSVDERHGGVFTCVAENELDSTNSSTEVIVYEPPEITGSDDVTRLWVLEGESVEMLCPAKATPVPVITWFKSGQPDIMIQRNEPGHIQLLKKQNIFNITSARISDTGHYYCTATNIEGTTKKHFELDVYVKPSIEDDDGDNTFNVPLRDDFTLLCNVDGIPLPTIRWFKGPLEITPDNEGIHIDRNGQSLTVYDSELRDGGSYTCTAENVVGEAAKDFFINIFVPPSILGGNRTFEIAVGRYLSIECRATGIPTPVISWYQNNQGIAVGEGPNLDVGNVLENGRYLEFRSIALEDEGEYHCIATNDAGVDTRTHTVNVLVPPRFLDDDFPSKLSVVEGDDVSLMCRVSGDPHPTVEWMKDGVPLGDQDTYELSETGDRLTISGSSYSDRGRYTCVASNSVGTIRRDQILDVLVVPTIDGSGDEVVDILKGEPLTLYCMVDGNPTPVVSWERDGIPITANDKISFSLDNQRLILNNIDESDTGVYTCTASNIVGSDDKDFTVNVLVPPTVLPFSREVYDVLETENIHITCTATGIPEPRVQWYRDGKPVEKSQYFKHREQGRMLVILNANVDIHDGIFTCLATSKIGFDSRDATVNVLVPPSIYGQDFTTETDVIEGNGISLLCRVLRGKPEPEIEWYYEDVNLAPELNANWNFDTETEILTNSRASTDNTGSYWCKATNPAGIAIKKYSVAVQVTPYVYGEPTEKKYVIERNNITFSCHTSGIPAPNITWTKNNAIISDAELEKYQQTQIDENTFELSVVGAERDDEAVYSCIATNEAGEDSKDFHLSVYLPPSYEGNQETRIVFENENTSLVCDVEAYPPPVIRWYFNGRPLDVSLDSDDSGSDNRILEIKNAKISDAGHYKCEAENIAGITEKNVRLQVYSPPKVIGNDTEYIKKLVGDRVTLICEIRGVPPPSLSWFKNGEALSVNDERYSLLLGAKTFMISRAELDDAGQYECLGESAAGRAVKSFTLVVHEPPMILSENEERYINRGESYRLECFATGFPEPKISWYKDGKKLLSDSRYNFLEDNQALEVSGSVESDAGEYYCNASNMEAYDIKSFRVKILIPPVIDNTRDERWVEIGQNVNLTCNVLSNALFEIQWLYEGRPIASSELARISQNGRKLMLYNVQRAREGRYTCLVRNSAGSDQKNTLLHVYIPPAIRGPPLEFVNVTKTRSVSLVCDATGYPQPIIKWSKDFRPIQSNDTNQGKYSISKDGTILTVHDSAVSDVGSYICTARNIGGSADKEYRLDILVPPQIMRRGTPKVTSAREHSSIKLECAARGHPAPEIAWLKDGSSLNEINGIQISNRFGDLISILVIHRVTEDHAGTYTCTADNSVGHDEFDADVIVNVAPVIQGSDQLEPESIEAPIGNNAELECVVLRGYPKPVIEWRKGSRKIVSGGHMKLRKRGRFLQISGMTLDDSGFYTCIAENSVGIDSKEYNVIALEAPEFDRKDKGTLNITVGFPLFLTCDIYARPLPKMTWYKDGVPISLDGNHQNFYNGRVLHVRRTKVTDDGVYTCVASNKAGSDSQTTNVNIFVPPEISGSDRNNEVDVLLGNPTFLNCTDTKGNPKSEISWFQNGVELNLQDTNFLTYNDGQVLSIGTARLNDSGRYECYAKNPAGLDRKDFKINVLVPPTISGPAYEEVTLLEGRRYQLDCKSEGLPTPVNTWYKDSVTISQGRRYSRINKGLQLGIYDADEDDNGIFACVASNVGGSARKVFNATVYMIPRIDDGGAEQDVIVKEGNDATLQCHSDTFPTPTVKWLYRGVDIDTGDDKFIISEDGFQLKIIGSVLEDAGDYMCELNNAAGVTSRKINVIVHQPPEISGADVEYIEKNVDSTVLLQCYARGYPKPEIDWLKDGAPVAFSQRVRFLPRLQSLIIERSTEQDAGNYSCMANNDAGKDKKDYILDILVPPHIDETIGESNIQAVKGDQVALACAVDAGNPTPSIEWFKDGQSLPDKIQLLELGSLLLLPDVQVSDEAVYKCIASNKVGQSHRDMSLTVLVPPEVDAIGFPDHVQVNVNTTATLHCDVTGGIPPPEIIWFHDGQPLYLSSRMRTFSDGNRLEIYQSSVSDSGNYTCIASNTAGSVSDKVRLDVYVPPAFVSPGDKDIYLPQGESTTLDCSVSGRPNPTVAWTYKEKNARTGLLDMHERLDMSSNGKIVTLNDARVSDTGLYSCIASSISGSAEKSFNVFVMVPPQIIGGNDDENRQVIEHTQFTLNCESRGTPQPTVTWFKDGVAMPMFGDSRIQNNGQRLVIEDSQLDDSGAYECRVTSDAGFAKKLFNVDVIVPPSSGNAFNITAVVGSNVELDCMSDAVPPPEFFWFKDNSPMSESGSIVNLMNVQLSDAGIYECDAVNNAGTSTRMIGLNVYKKPTIVPGPDKIVALVHETVKITCDADGVPPPMISWWKDSRKLSSGDPRIVFSPNSMKIVNLQLADQGDYTCVATNNAGSAHRNILIEVQDPPVIASGPTNITAIANSPVTLQCNASGTPNPKMSWSKDYKPFDIDNKIGGRLDESGSLHIGSVSLEDTAIYTCLAENTAGSASRDINLFVQVPPSILNTVTQYIAEPLSRVTVPCKAYGVPKPTVSWNREGVSLDRILGTFVNSFDNSLDIPSIANMHVGRYTCVAENTAGRAEHTVEIKVQKAPRIVETVGDLSGLEGTTATLFCIAEGTPSPSITWKKGPQVIEEDERHGFGSDGILTISNLQVSDTDEYTCVAQNPAGYDFARVKLDVYVLPSILAEFEENTIAVAGEPFKLAISPFGIPDPQIFWTKDNSHVDFEVNDHFLTDDDGSLIIPIVLPSDEGIYNVSAVNPAGSTSVFTKLTVLIPPDIRTTSSDINVRQGQRALLAVTVSGKPAPDITWSKSGEKISPEHERIHQTPDGSLEIVNAQSLDGGLYTVTATSDAGRSSAQIRVTVLIPPTFVETPQDQQKVSGSDMSLVCAAVGYPTPEMSWEFNDKPIHGVQIVTNSSGTSMLFIENLSEEDAGTYICEASNVAGTISTAALVTIDLPPVLTGDYETEIIANVGETTRLDCLVTSNPLPVISWTKNGRDISLNDHFTMFPNGSLLIHDVQLADAGDYKCSASNKAGYVEAKTKLVLRLAPKFTLRPTDIVADAGTTVVFDCQATARPEAKIRWRKMNRRLPQNGRFIVLRNNSLQILNIQLKDTGEFQCFATNDIGSRIATASLTVKVHGRFGEWGQFGPCSVSCGRGTQTRSRSCDSPPPANGGRSCQGENINTRICHQRGCPVHGNWGEFGPWEGCSVSCGRGTEARTRECNNPAPEFGGNACKGEGVEMRGCSASACPVDGRWSSWGSWRPCSVSCGEGVSTRSRSCTNPSPLRGGRECPGSDTETKLCLLRNCSVNGNWGQWASYSVCSVSCGGGTKTRVRTCSDPAPSNGGEICPGSNVQVENCYIDRCPVNGQWADWEPWKPCSVTCGRGQQHRYRSCTSPRPRHGGRYCPGSDVNVRQCGTRNCPEDGGWSDWTEWTACSVTCGSGVTSRRRACDNPVPRNNGRYCNGNATQISTCSQKPCQSKAISASGVLHGNVNGVPIIDSAILSNSIESDDKVSIISIIKDIPPEIGDDLRNQVSILTPIYWTFAKEINGAYNGHTLTTGQFLREVNVEFPSGEIVEMYHNAKGVNKYGNLDIEIEINGDVPMFPADIDLNIRDYVEDYVQTGLDSIYAHSDRFYTVNGGVMLYTWTHNINYDQSWGVMPYLVEQLYGSNIIAEYDKKTKELRFQIDVWITKGDNGDECPVGFLIDETQSFCNDIDECDALQPCSHNCLNSIGSYLCECPEGFHLGMNGHTCEDIDECSESLYDCEAPYVCENLRGSYRCILVCGVGLQTSDDGRSCIDIDECETGTERVCEHVCQNTQGSFSCQCRNGYLPVNVTKCEDIDECARGACYGDITRCRNTAGSYTCVSSCPTGFRRDLVSNACVDTDECSDSRLNRCDQICENVRGSYKCSCNTGFLLNGTTGLCQDLDECRDGRGPCQYGCLNKEGSYICYCPTGYRLTSNGHSCEDINECLEGEPKCVGRDLLCANVLGDYRCVNIDCPPGYKMDNNVCIRNCLGGECGDVAKSVIRFNSTFLRVGVPQNQDLIALAVSYSDADGQQLIHSNTVFRLMTPLKNKARTLFGLRVVDDRGIIYTKIEIGPQHVDWYRLKVAAHSEGEDGSNHFETIFSLFINVAPNPFY